MRVYVVYWHDRHTDPGVVVCATRERADAEIEIHKSIYEENGYAWRERDFGRSVGWVRYVESDNDDGPNGRIMECEVQS